jgi:hypothetical protein
VCAEVDEEALTVAQPCSSLDHGARAVAARERRSTAELCRRAPLELRRAHRLAAERGTITASHPPPARSRALSPGPAPTAACLPPHACRRHQVRRHGRDDACGGAGGRRPHQARLGPDVGAQARPGPGVCGPGRVHGRLRGADAGGAPGGRQRADGAAGGAAVAGLCAGRVEPRGALLQPPGGATCGARGPAGARYR